MATLFPVSSYPLAQGGKEHVTKLGVDREVMSDGTPHLWVTSDTQWRERELKFVPLNNVDAASLSQYLFDNRMTEFDVPMHGNTFTGYLWSDPSMSEKDGRWWVTVAFYGRKTA